MTSLHACPSRPARFLASAAIGIAAVAASASAQGRELPKFEDVSKGYTKITSGGGDSLYGIWFNEKEQQLLAELPRGWQRQRYFIAATPAAGVIFSGLQGPARYVFWRDYGDRIALIEPQLEVRSSGEAVSRTSVSRIFTDRVVLELPVVSRGPSGQPVIDLDQLLVGNAQTLARQPLNGRLATFPKVKAFPQNIEVAVEAPDPGGVLKSVHYSISLIPDGGPYKPRPADDRVGYFTTEYRDLGQYGNDTNWTRYINRWDLQKRDPKLSLSPPKEPIVFYIEHTTPVRYRRWVREGVLQWNEAFRKIGLDEAIVVYQQDEMTGAHMDKDPEDVRYNFVRWLNNDVATAIGPSRAHPLTGQILDADIILTDGWIRAFFNWHEDRPMESAMSLGAEALSWLEDHPQWDPRVQLVPPMERAAVLAERESRRVLGDSDPADSRKDPILAGDPVLQEIQHFMGDQCAHCLAAHGLAMEMAFSNMHLDMHGLLGGDGEGDGEGKSGDLLDGVPEWFVGPQLAHLVAHEVGHTLGLRHNFKASGLYSFDEVNSEEMKGQPFAASVMDYIGTNFNYTEDLVQGDHTMVGIGPYDMWAIEYGYGFGDPKKVLERVGEPQHAYLTDEDTGGPDPLARRYDFGRDPLAWARNQIEMIRHQREHLLTNFVKDGDSWQKARRGYLKTLGRQRQMIDVAAAWVGGTHVNRVRKGDPNTGDPLVPVDAGTQREALALIVDQAFQDESFGITPELVNKLTVEKWWGDRSAGASSTWPIVDAVAATQNLALTLIMNPTTLGRVYDNELRLPADADALTLPEVFAFVADDVYRELDAAGIDGAYSERQPLISTFRRNLQADLTDRLIALATGRAQVRGPIRQLALMHLRSLDDRLDGMMTVAKNKPIDAYSMSHLMDMRERTSKALDAVYVVQ
jgi:hypothetical protein